MSRRGAALSRRGRRCRRGRGLPPNGLTGALSRLYLRLGTCGDRARNQQEILTGDGVFVFAAKKMLIEEHVDIRRQDTGPGLSLKQTDGASVLLAAEDQLSLLLALRHLLPDRHEGGHEDGRDAQGHKKRRHRITLLRIARSLTA